MKITSRERNFTAIGGENPTALYTTIWFTTLINIEKSPDNMN